MEVTGADYRSEVAGLQVAGAGVLSVHGCVVTYGCVLLDVWYC